MTARSSLRHYIRIIQYFVLNRGAEVLLLQASPVFGCVLAGFSMERSGLIQPILLFLGSVALTAHIFVINDWAGYNSDIHDPTRAANPYARYGISRREVGCFGSVLLLLALLAFVFVGWVTLLLGMTITVIGMLYSCHPRFGKNTPIVGSINHLLGGCLHFLLGYTGVTPPTPDSIVIGLFFGLIFAGGHLNQEIRDSVGDRLNHIRTSAVVFGCERAFGASLCLFTAAYILVTCLAVYGMMPRVLLWSPVVWILHVVFAWQAFQRGLGYDTAIWMQRRYRILFALIGVAMIGG